MEAYNFDDKVAKLDRAGLLYAVLSDFADLDLRPAVVSNEAMGYIFEELLRKFSEMSNETAGEHYTPREVITLMVELLLSEKTSAELDPEPQAGAHGLRPRGRHRRMLDGRAAPDHPAQPRRGGQGLRPGAERRDRGRSRSRT